MSVKRCSLCLVFVLALILLGACTWPTPTPGCSVTDLVQPIPSGPAHNQTDLSLTTSILWSYGAGWECQPDGFVLQIAHDQLFTDMVAEVETVTTMWTVSPALDPADEYWWRVAGGVGTAGSLSLGPWSERQRFFTGPVCTAAQLVAPIPLAPPNGGIMDEEWGPVYFDYPASAGLPASVLPHAALHHVRFCRHQLERVDSASGRGMGSGRCLSGLHHVLLECGAGG